MIIIISIKLSWTVLEKFRITVEISSFLNLSTISLIESQARLAETVATAAESISAGAGLTLLVL